jgi:hypothetical protein
MGWREMDRRQRNTSGWLREKVMFPSKTGIENPRPRVFEFLRSLAIMEKKSESSEI